MAKKRFESLDSPTFSLRGKSNLKQHNTARSVLFDDAVIYQNYVASMVDGRNMSMKHLWNSPDREELKYSGDKPVSVAHCPTADQKNTKY
jgi:hypothetical protein